MIEPNQDQETPAETIPSLQSPQPKRPHGWHASTIVSAVIVLSALVLIFAVLLIKPAWLRACPLLQQIRPANMLFKIPATLSVAEVDTGTPITVQVAQQPTITPAPTLSMATATSPVTITPAPTSQPPRANPIPSALPGQYEPQEGSPFYISAKPFQDSEQACNWIGIAGQAFDAEDAPRSNLVVVVDGKIGDKNVNLTTTTGTAPLYGPAGYEIGISLKAQDSEETLTIQLFDDLGQPLSAKVTFATYASCEKNLAIVNFVETR